MNQQDMHASKHRYYPATEAAVVDALKNAELYTNSITAQRMSNQDVAPAGSLYSRRKTFTEECKHESTTSSSHDQVK